MHTYNTHPSINIHTYIHTRRDGSGTITPGELATALKRLRKESGTNLNDAEILRVCMHACVFVCVHVCACACAGM